MNSSCKLAVSMVKVTALVAAFGSIGKAAPVDVPDTVTIATGKVGGIYHPVGGAICKLVNENTAEHGISCTIAITGGSSGNIRDLREGRVALAMAQSDLQYSAVKGIGPFEEDSPFDAMRSMFALYVEQFTLVARDDADIRSFKDLKGKRVYMGPPGSGKRETMNVILDAFGWSRDEVQDISKLKASNVAEALCDNEIDAFVYTIGHPSPLVREAVATCRAVLAPVSGRVIERLVSNSPIYVSTVIPKGTYKGQSRDIPTLGLIATLVTTEKTHPEIVYQVTKAFFENLDRLREASPLFWSLTTREMVSSGRTAPLHEGASRYFAEAGLQ
jgi:TRAP transporter TAXI family solute receptor